MNYETSIASDTDLLDPEGAASSRRKRNLIIAIVLLTAAAMAAAYFFFGGTSTEEEAAAAADKLGQAQTVSVVAPGRETVARAISATGTLAARREIPVGVVGEGGQVSQVFVDAGDWVQQGQVLASIERSVQSQQIIGQEAQINAARADLQLAQNELDRAMQLVSRGFISKADVDRKTATRDSARARVSIADAQLRELRARTARLDIRAPVGGYVLERSVEPGQTVSQGSGVLFRMAKGGELELQAQLGETELAMISVGVPATVTPVGSDRQFNGTIWQIAPTINQQSRQGIARIALPFDRALKPGGFAAVEIKAGAVTAAVLPESAIQNDRDGSFVYIVNKQNKVQRRAVKTGIITQQGIAINEGLDGTERVVLYAGGFLNPDETVKPKLVKTAAQSAAR
ncbi:efflux RND transporter periplasmic adaptor subunit [Sphingorhabdus pulchriflava]|uniref:Efflux RND transporter periplasmic adaptor subunit n=1 Tax=Sphingorhabdus pulchriflava TaxID=2292257 RepID=A0A371BHW9_9SPHN|nr:efflux RND transporter periplasmic adaptor subunit [Sphingorhabdus pulchriflava]RDV07150.1 efflux RND transporter periplasmic adaptor subunit [Sphingorhabdus pulchriflava]